MTDNAQQQRRFYSLGPEQEFEEHDTADEAKAAAQEWLDNAANDGMWHEQTDSIEWGELLCRGRVVETKRTSKEDDETGHCACFGCDELVEYEMRDEGENG